MKIITDSKKSIHIDSVDPEKHIIAMVDRSSGGIAVLMRQEYGGDSFRFQLLSQWDLESGNGWDGGTDTEDAKELIELIGNRNREFYAFKNIGEFFTWAVDQTT